MLRDLLVQVDGGDAGRRRVQFAVDLTVRTGGRLSGLHVTPPTEVPPGYKLSRIDQVARNKHAVPHTVQLVEEAMSINNAVRTIFANQIEQVRAINRRYGEPRLKMSRSVRWGTAQPTALFVSTGGIACLQIHHCCDAVIKGRQQWRQLRSIPMRPITSAT
jgi:hypothetical protein